MTPEINIPEVLAEVRAAFARYEQALITNDVAVLDELFWDSERTVRYGGGENLYGIAAIRGFRGARSPVGLERDLAGTVITTFGRDFATASTLYRRRSSGLTGRQMQSWVRLPTGWRVVAAHVSMLDFAFPEPAGDSNTGTVNAGAEAGMAGTGGPQPGGGRPAAS